MSTTPVKRLEIFGFQLRKNGKRIETPLTQKALNAREAKNYKRLYHLLHRIKILRGK